MKDREFDLLGDKVKVLLTGLESNGQLEVVEFTSPQLSGPPPHSHPWMEATFVLEGTLEVFMNQQTSTYHAGSFFCAPPGQIHTYKVVSSQARFLTISNPSGIYGFLAELAREFENAPEDIAKILAISAKHQVTVALPA